METNTKKKLDIEIVYSGEAGFGFKYQQLATFLHDKFPGRLHITKHVAPPSSNKFEVLVTNGPVIHSREAGMGLVDTPEKMQFVVDVVTTILGDLEHLDAFHLQKEGFDNVP